MKQHFLCSRNVNTLVWQKICFFRNLWYALVEVRKLGDTSQKERVMRIYTALQEKGYNPVGQIVGYILSEDPTYITNHNGARSLISRIDREELLKDMVKAYLK